MEELRMRLAAVEEAIAAANRHEAVGKATIRAIARAVKTGKHGHVVTSGEGLPVRLFINNLNSPSRNRWHRPIIGAVTQVLGHETVYQWHLNGRGATRGARMDLVPAPKRKKITVTLTKPRST